MVTKSPKKRVLKPRPIQHTSNLRVRIQKLDETVYNRLIGIHGNPTSIKEERPCRFASAVDLNDNEPVPNECSVPCQCNYCSPSHEFKWDDLKQYLETEEQENFGSNHPYLCDLVNENVSVPTVEKCDASTQTASQQYKFTCKECNCQFNNQYYYEQHKSVHVRRLYECAFCNATYDSDKQMQNHILMHMNKNFYECIECGCAYRNKNLLIKHIKSHNKNFFECGECKAQFQSDKGLQNHKQTHVSSGKMIHVFRIAKGVLQSEIQQGPTIVETETANLFEEQPTNAHRFYVCPFCQLTFPDASKFARHSQIHKRKASQFLHFCNICGARFRANNHLVCHKRHAHKL